MGLGPTDLAPAEDDEYTGVMVDIVQVGKLLFRLVACRRLATHLEHDNFRTYARIKPQFVDHRLVAGSHLLVGRFLIGETGLLVQAGRENLVTAHPR